MAPLNWLNFLTNLGDHLRRSQPFNGTWGFPIGKEQGCGLWKIGNPNSIVTMVWQKMWHIVERWMETVIQKKKNDKCQVVGKKHGPIIIPCSNSVISINIPNGLVEDILKAVSIVCFGLFWVIPWSCCYFSSKTPWVLPSFRLWSLFNGRMGPRQDLHHTGCSVRWWPNAVRLRAQLLRFPGRCSHMKLTQEPLGGRDWQESNLIDSLCSRFWISEWVRVEQIDYSMLNSDINNKNMAASMVQNSRPRRPKIVVIWHWSILHSEQTGKQPASILPFSQKIHTKS